MTKSKVTIPKAATAATKGWQAQSQSAAAKTAAGSTLSQKPPAKGKK